MAAPTRDALLQEHIIAQWQTWRRYLTIQLELLDVRVNPFAAAPDVFEASITGEQHEQRLIAELAAIPSSVRDLFVSAIEERREHVQAALDAAHRAASNGRSHPLDADQIDRQTYTELLNEAEGIDTGGIGSVPMDDDWYQVDATKLERVPDNGRYQLAGTKRISMVRLGGMILVIVAGLLGVWWTVPRAQSDSKAESSMTMLANDQPLTPWAPHTLVVHGAVSESYDVMPPALAGSGDAQLQAPAPLTICVPETTLDRLTSVELRSAGDAPTRSYTIQPGDGNTDLLLRACGTSRVAASGVLTQFAPPMVRALGDVASFGGGAAAVQLLTVVGPAEDASLPANRIQLDMTITTRGLDWKEVTPTIRWLDGQDILPSVSNVQSSTVDLRYLIPAFVAPTDMQVRLTHTSGVMHIWQTTLTPPPDRATLLAEALRDITLTAERGPATGALHITLTLTNQSATPLTLSVQDIVVQQAERRIAVPPLTALATPIQPDEQRIVPLILTVPSGQLITLNVGNAVFQVTSP